MKLLNKALWWALAVVESKIEAVLYEEEIVYPQENDSGFVHWVKWVAVLSVLIPAIIFFGGIEWFFGLFAKKRNMNFKECLKCREGFDMSTQPFYNLFCPNCHNALGEDGMKIVDGFLFWATRTHPSVGKSDQVALSVFNALSNDQPREKLIEALQFYTSTDLVDLMYFSMLLEEYDEYLVRRRR